MQKSSFHVRINNGPVLVIKTRTGLYHLAVGVALGMLPYEPKQEDLIEIWCPELLPDYGPYFYIHNETGQIYSIPNPEDKNNLS